MIPGRAYTLDDLLAIAWRRRWMIVVPFLTVSLGTALVAYRLPARWMSTAVISIVPQRVPESYVRSTVTIGPQDRLESIRRGILSRPRLEEIIVEFNLYPDLRKTAVMDDVVERMREDVRMTLVKGDAFEVCFYAGDPQLAQRVAARLASLFIAENIRQRAQLAAGSSEFLNSQLEEARQQLVTTEQRLESFRRTYSGQLPDQVPANMQAVSNAQMQLQHVRDSINRDRDRRLMVERQVAAVNTVDIDAVAAPQPATAGAASSAASAAERLLQESARLEALERRLTPEHPDIIHGRKTVADLVRDAEAERQGAGAKSAEWPPRTAAALIRRNRTRELETELASIDRTIASRHEEERRLLDVAASYQARVDAAPARESELTALMRDYDTVSQQYKDLLANSKAAEMSQDLERRQGGEQFRLVEEAGYPIGRSARGGL